MEYHYRYTEPVLLEDDSISLKYYDIHDNELLHLQIQIKLMLKVLVVDFHQYMYI